MRGECCFGCGECCCVIVMIILFDCLFVSLINIYIYIILFDCFLFNWCFMCFCWFNVFQSTGFLVVLDGFYCYVHCLCQNLKPLNMFHTHMG